jgi:HK97 gp10 family phage protein
MAGVSITATVEGTDLVLRMFNGITVRITAYAGTAVEQACRRIVARARSLAPVRTGRLRDSIGYAMRGPTLGVVGLGPPGDKYWYLLEFGTRFAPAHPFMRPAAEPEAAAFTVQMSNAINRAVAYEAAYAEAA